MAKKTKHSRSESEDREYLRGIIRKKDKQVKLLEREVLRLTKYLMRVEFDVSWDDKDEPKIKAPTRPSDWKCSECGHYACDEISLPQGSVVRKYVTCKQCGDRTRVIINGKPVDT